jgi:hypothetical protein
VRPGDVIRLPEIQGVRAKEGSDLVLVFLGACELADKPNVPIFLRQLGFARTHAFEVTLYWLDAALGEETPCTATRHVYLAESPPEALAAACRFARAMNEAETELSLAGLSLCLTRLGEIAPNGHPHNGRGQVFARWSLDAGGGLDSLDELERRATAEAAPVPMSKADECDAAGPAE